MIHEQGELRERVRELLHGCHSGPHSVILGARPELINGQCDAPSIPFRDVLKDGYRVFVVANGDQILRRFLQIENDVSAEEHQERHATPAGRCQSVFSDPPSDFKLTSCT